MPDTTVDQLKEYLDVKFELVSLQYTNIQEDVTEIKEHVKETNGQVAVNTTDITVLQVKQRQDDKTRKWIGGGLIALSTTITGWILAELLHIGGR